MFKRVTQSGLRRSCGARDDAWKRQRSKVRCLLICRTGREQAASALSNTNSLGNTAANQLSLSPRTRRELATSVLQVGNTQHCSNAPGIKCEPRWRCLSVILLEEVSHFFFATSLPSAANCSSGNVSSFGHQVLTVPERCLSGTNT